MGRRIPESLVIVLYCVEASQAPTYGLLPGCNLVLLYTAQVTRVLEAIPRTGLVLAGPYVQKPTHESPRQKPSADTTVHTSSPSRDGIESGFNSFFADVGLLTLPLTTEVYGTVCGG